MQDEMREPLNVFAVDEKMNRCTGSIPYRSLIWRRKYTEPGDFEMVVPANIFDPSWAYIVCDDRPEMGIVQKVQFADDAQTYDGVDSVTVSGFFLESILNRIVFLAESPEEEKVYIPQPRRPAYLKSQNPKVYQDTAGGFWFENSSGQLEDAVTGAVIGSDQTEGLTEVDYKDAFGSSYGSDVTYCNYNYYTGDDRTKITKVDVAGGETEYDVAFSDDNGNVFYYDGSGRLTQAVGVVTSSSGTYYARMKKWRALPEDAYGRYETVVVKGPWQRTEMMEPVTVGDSINIVFKWARRMMGDWIIYVEPTIEGVQKSVDPSFQYLGDLLYKTLYEVGASLRLEYSFESNAYYLSVYRGDDRTQGNGIDAAAMKTARVMTVSESSRSTISRLPAGYTEVDYIQGGSGQWIDTGVTPGDGDFSIIMDVQPVDPPSTEAWFCTIGRDMPTGQTGGWMQIGIYGGKYAVHVTNDFVDGSETASSDKSRISLDVSGNTLNLTVGQVYTKSSSNILNGGYRDKTVSFFKWPMKLYGASIVKNGQVSCRLIPCTRDQDGSIGLFDTVSGSFFENVGTGDFIAGSNIEFVEIEYIQSSGTQYIDTGYLPNGDTRVLMDLISPQNNSANVHVASCVSGSYYYNLFRQPSGIWCTRYGTSAIVNINGSKNVSGRVVADKNKNVTTVGEYTAESQYQGFQINIPLYVFARNNNGTSVDNIASFTLYSMKIYDNGVIARDFIPVTRNGEAGLYDLANGEFYGNDGSGSFAAGNAASQITYMPNSTVATGSTPPTTGFVGNTVEIAQCWFVVENGTFTGWNTQADGQGTSYLPGAKFVLPDGGITLYATWDIEEPPEPEPPSGKAPWAVFSDTWGTLNGYGASRDTSNYRNTCYVLYDYDLPNSFDENGWPSSGFIYQKGDYLALPTLYGIAYTRKRGYNIEHVGDDCEPSIETYLDVRDEKPSCDGDWSRDLVELPSVEGSERQQAIAQAQSKFAPPSDGNIDLESIYNAWDDSLKGLGEQHLKDNYYIVNALDTGLVSAKDYLHGFDLGDLVDMEVSTLGFTQEARIIEVEENYTSGNVEIKLTMGDKKLTNIQKARLA